MGDLTIDFEWLDPLAAKGAELRATWARLCIIIDDYPVTRVFDHRSKTMRDAVYLPLYPLAEWLVEKWWSLWNEPESSFGERSQYDSRHSFAHAREGYALPPIQISPAGSTVRVSWFPEKLAYHQLEFLGQDEVWIKKSVLAERFSSFIEAIVSRLDVNEITDSRLQQDWAAIKAADADEKTFCECAGALGLDSYDLDDNQKETIEQIGNRLPEEIVAEFFCSARPELASLQADATEVMRAIKYAQDNTKELGPLRKLREHARTWTSSQATSWEQGYAFAHKLRAYLGLNGTRLKTMQNIETALSIGPDDLDSACREFSSHTIPFAALMGINNYASPTFVLRPTHPASLRFQLCRALFEYLYVKEKMTSLVTDANTEQQKRNRAFAAELLAPAAVLKDQIRTPRVTLEKVDEIAEEFGVSSYVIVHQLNNHGIASVYPG